MLLACDIGNTNIVVGVFRGENLLATFRIHTRPDATRDEYASLFSSLLSSTALPSTEFEGCVISSVVPALSSEVGGALQKLTAKSPFIVSPGIKTGLNILYDDPREVGSDRIADAVAGLALESPPLIIVDFGTATTFNLVLPPANYVGGLIAPGIVISMEALARRTAKLQEVELTIPPSTVGKNTSDAIRSGILLGHGAMVDGIIERVEIENGISANVIATGGHASLVKQISKKINRVEPNLTLLGLRIIWEKNKMTLA